MWKLVGVVVAAAALGFGVGYLIPREPAVTKARLKKKKAACRRR